MQRKTKKKQNECEKHRWQETEKKNGKVMGFKCVNCGIKSKDMKDDPNVIWSYFRCHNVQCNKLLEHWEVRENGFCTGCQGSKFVIATYLTDEEVANIKSGEIIPKKINLGVVGIEPPLPREVR